MRAQAQSPLTCAWHSWTDAATITDSAMRPIYVEAPSMASVSDDYFLVGYPVYVWKTQRVFADSGTTGARDFATTVRDIGVLLSSEGSAKLVAMPASVEAMAAPHALSIADTAADVFWGEAPQGFVGPTLATRALWHGRFNGATWSSVDKIFETDRISWNVSQPALIAVNGRAEIAVPAYGLDGGVRHSGILFIERHGREWRRSWVDTPGVPPSYVSLAETKGGRRIIVFVGGLRRSPDTPPGIYATLSERGSTRWSTPALVAPLESSRPAWNTVLLVDELSRVHLLWSDQVPPGFENTARLYHAASRDSGKTWNILTALALPRPVDVFRAVVVNRAEILVLMRFSGRGTVGVASVDSATWSPIATPFARSALSLPTLARPTGDRIVALWGTGQAGASPVDPNFAAPKLVLAQRKAQCDRQ